MLEIDAILLHIKSPEVSWRGSYGAWLPGRDVKLVDGERSDRKIYAYSDRIAVCLHTGQSWVKSGKRYVLVKLKWSERRKAKRAMNKRYQQFLKDSKAKRAKEASIAASALAINAAKEAE